MSTDASEEGYSCSASRYGSAFLYCPFKHGKYRGVGVNQRRRVIAFLGP